MYRKIADMTWPAPCEEMSDLVHRLVWPYGAISATDGLKAAGIINAYTQMVNDPAKKRQRIVSELRQGPNLPRPPEPPKESER